jgi:hypothetical protein
MKTTLELKKILFIKSKYSSDSFEETAPKVGVIRKGAIMGRIIGI